ncbi:hypothetical protein [Paraliomyxa miuraensis]|uniref:hypothetical protein n=1 Tax=Paraliomyxa miuraensis TaxID=376150 RepID=UPI00225A7F6E|nr:hypothetical protein [Paraliomyxa miuraensis]MCX4243598.1 hypothetical protein [Paraliomyxa miuraensis]
MEDRSIESAGTKRHAAWTLGLMWVLVLGASCDDESKGDAEAAPCDALESCKGIEGHCFVLEPGGGTELDAAQRGFRGATGKVVGDLRIRQPDGTNPFPYFEGPEGVGFDLDASKTTGVFEYDETTTGELQIKACVGLASTTKWGWCSLDDEGNLVEKSHDSDDCRDSEKVTSTLSFPALDDDGTTYRLRIWGVGNANGNGIAIAGDPKIRAKGASPNPTPSFPPPIPVCPEEYDYYEGCLAGQYEESRCPVDVQDSKIDYQVERVPPKPNVSSPFWVYYDAGHEAEDDGSESVTAAEDLRSRTAQSPSVFGDPLQLNPLTAKFVLSDSDAGGRDTAFIYVSTLANYDNRITAVHLLPSGTTWKSVTYRNTSDPDDYTNLYDSMARFLNCLSGVSPLAAPHVQVAATDRDGQPATVSAWFPYPPSLDDSNYHTCATQSKTSDGFDVFCSGGSCS